LIFPSSHFESGKDKTFQGSEQMREKQNKVAGLMWIVHDQRVTNYILSLWYGTFPREDFFWLYLQDLMLIIIANLFLGGQVDLNE
jgi:hypothetical protein